MENKDNNFLYEVILSCDNAEEQSYNLYDNEKICGAEILDDNNIKIFLEKIEDKDNFIDYLNSLDFKVEEIKEIKNENWTLKCKDFYKPLKIKNLFITPEIEGQETILDDNLLNIKIVPGMAFGTGHHETTKSALLLLQDEALLNNKDKIKKILDVGSGTCILSIASAFLFNTNVLAFDNDPTTLQNANENILLNKKQDSVTNFLGTIEDVKENDFDLILANIYAEILIEIFPKILEKSSLNSFLILSGIEKAKLSLVLDVYESEFGLLQQIIEGNWATLLLKRK